jgi:crossover junction endodeoxyribonuclease RuvC
VATILAIDPGVEKTGFAVLKRDKSIDNLVKYGCLFTSKEQPAAQRLNLIYQGMTDLIDRYRPDVLVIEKLFFNRNVKTAIAVGQAQGVVLLAGAGGNLEIAWYTPGEVKQAVCGYGKATKSQVQQMVKEILGLDDIPRPDDAADAVALAICHASTVSYTKSLVNQR